MVDTHAHLALQEKFSQVDLRAILDQAWQSNVSAIIIPTGSLDELKNLESVLALDQRLHGLVGYHPEDAGDISLIQVKRLMEYFKNPQIVGLGEAGIDFYWKDSLKVREDQKALCAEQLQLALELDRPICLHLRDKDDRSDAADMLLKLLTTYPAKAILHSCTLSPEQLKPFLELSACYISFSGILTFKSAEEVRESAKIVPLNRLLIETDSPYLAPEPYRGSLNTPAFVRLIAEKLAEIRKVEFNVLDQQLETNSKLLFGLHF